MERAKVFKVIELIEEYRKQVILKTALSISKIRDWARWEHDGRIYVGWKRACCPPLVNIYSRYVFVPLSALEIVRRKIRKWKEK